MKSVCSFLLLLIAVTLQSQVGREVSTWKPWFIKSTKSYTLPVPKFSQDEVAQIVSLQQRVDSAQYQKILYWNAGAPGYRWSQLNAGLFVSDTSVNGVGVMASMLLQVAIYDATITAWNIKYTHNRRRPYQSDSRIKLYALRPQSPSYPCEHSVTAGVAVTILSHYYPFMADSVKRMAEDAMTSRIAAGLAFPTDTQAGFELGKRIAQQEIEYAKSFLTYSAWDGKVPQGPGYWRGKRPMYPVAGFNKTVVLDSSSQFRPGPPPDFAKEMAELKSFKQNFRSLSNAFFWAGEGSFWEESLNKKIFEHNIHLNPPLAAKLYAIDAVALYDGFVACWDAKFAYWGLRPNQYDTTFQPALLITPPFPGYPSGHAVVSGVKGELYGYLFPEAREFFRKKARDAAESRFQAGIHFRSDNEVGLELGKKVAWAIIEKVRPIVPVKQFAVDGVMQHKSKE